MQLTYRGIKYDYQPVEVQTSETEVTGKYRGLDWRFRHQTTPILQPTVNLTYRGVAYTKGEVITSQVTETAKTADVSGGSMEEKARCLMFNRTQTIKKRQQTILSRTAASLGLNLDHYWSHIQGKVQPTFRYDYDRLGASMS